MADRDDAIKNRNVLKFKNLNEVNMQEVVNDPTTYNIEVKTGFGPNTPIYIDKEIIPLSRFHIGYSGKPVRTLGIHPTFKTMMECNVLEIPQPVYIDTTTRLAFGPELAIDCTPGAEILTSEGYRPARDFKKGDKLLVTKHNLSNHTEIVEDVEISHAETFTSLTSMQMPIYLFISEFQNMFIPFPIHIEGYDMVWLINFKQ